MDSAASLSSGSPADRGPAVFAVTAATLALASVFVASRMVSRCFIVKNVTWDDKVMLLAWLVSFFLSFTICLGVSNGLGKHDTDITAAQFPILRRCEYVFSILYNPALMATKTSILIFYLRMARNTQTVLRVASWATLAIVNIAGLVLTFINIFQCTPVAAAWNSPVGDIRDANVTCIPLLTEFICAAPVNVVTDLAILVLPIPVLTSMRLPSRQKTILVLTFTIGVFVTIVDVVRIYYLQQAIVDAPAGPTNDLNSKFGSQIDFAFNASFALMWSAVEVNIGMACACVPTLKPLVRRLSPTMLYDADGSMIGRSTASSTPKSHQGSVTLASSNSPPALALPEPVASSPLADQCESVCTMELLTTPNTRSFGERSHSIVGNPSVRAATNHTFSTDGSYDNGVYFGFVNMTKPKSMLQANAAESFKYCTIVAILFLLWGVSYGLLNTLNIVIGAANDMTTAQTIGLTSAYFGGGYFFGPLLVGEWLLRRDEHSRSKRHQRSDPENLGGYKVTFITGLCIYGVGTIIFWPSAVTNSYGGFMLSNFVVGFGLSVLEVAANSFMILCGPPQHGETRLLLAQGVQAVGSVCSELLAQKVFFKSLSKITSATSMALINVQWTYLGITLLCVVLGLFFYYMPLPEVSDMELEESMKRLPVDPCKKSIGGLQLRTVALCLAVLAQYTYMAGQESNSTFARSLLVSLVAGQPRSGRMAAGGRLTPANAANSANSDKPPGITVPFYGYDAIGHSAFAISRFLAGYLTYLSVHHPQMPKPRTVLAISISLCFVSALACVAIHPLNPNLLVIPLCLFYFAEGPIWPLIFAIGLRGQGRRTKRAAAFITMGASGTAFFPFVMYGIIVEGGTVQMAYIVVVALNAVAITYPLFLDLVKDARLMVDPCPDTHDDVSRGDEERPVDEVLVDSNALTTGVMEKPHGILEKASRGFGAKLIGFRRKSSPMPEVEHLEGRADSQAVVDR